MNSSRLLAGRLVTQMHRLRYAHLIRQAWQAVRADAHNSSPTDSRYNSVSLNDTADVLVALSHDGR